MAEEDGSQETSGSAENKAQAGVNDSIGDAAAKAKNKIDEAASSTNDFFEGITETACAWGNSIADRTKERPVTALLVAMSVGFLIHMLTRRRQN